MFNFVTSVWTIFLFLQVPGVQVRSGQSGDGTLPGMEYSFNSWLLTLVVILIFLSELSFYSVGSEETLGADLVHLSKELLP